MSPQNLIHRRSSWRLAGGAILAASWVLAVTVLLGELTAHSVRPEPVSNGLTAWPRQSCLPRATSGMHVVVFAHPMCPCTQAALSELDETLVRIPSTTHVTVVFVTSGLPGKLVEGSRIVGYARRLKGVTVKFDETGDEARLFEARVSGEVLAYNTNGECLFRGGLTPARGHQGDAAGQELLEDVLCGRRTTPGRAPVFGCRLMKEP